MKKNFYYVLGAVPRKSKLWFAMRSADSSHLLSAMDTKGSYCKKHRNQNTHLWYFAIDEYVYASNLFETLKEKYTERGFVGEVVNHDEMLIRIAEAKLEAK